MRVLHVIDSLAASGGAEQGLVREITRFEGVEQMVAILYDRRDLSAEMEEAGIPVTVLGLPEGSGSRNWPRTLLPLRSLARSFRPDVIQSSLFLGNIVAQLVGRSLGVPVMSNLVLSGDPAHLKAFQPGADTRRAASLRAVAGWAARSRHVSFRALTEEVRQTNAELLGVDPGRVSVIPRGVPSPDPGPPASRQELGLPDGPLVVNVGRIAAQKGQTLLVEAFARVVAEVPMAHLVIVGRAGPAHAEVMSTVGRLGLDASVHLVGHTSRVGDYLAHAHVFAFSSVMEGLGTAVVEAMATGVPVVAFDIPPVREATADGRFGELVPVGDVPALAGALVRRLIGEPTIDAAARQWVAEHHDLDVVSSRVLELLREAAGANAGRG